LVQLPEPLNGTAGTLRTIADVTKERLRRAGKKVKEGSPLFPGDLGFRVFKLDASNIRAWDPNPDDIAGTLLDATEHLQPGRSESDILFELLLKQGLELTVPIEQRTFAGKAVHSIGGGTLFACLTPHISTNEVEPLALGIVEWFRELKPEGAVTAFFRDSAFADDVAKTNLAAILEQNGIAQVRSL
jgi:adenine-specific DNA-methyltransferase